MTTKKAVVTGGAGFIGSHLAEALLNRNYRVTVVDDLSSGKLENIRPFQDRIEFVKGTVTDLPALEEVFRGADYVFHLAAIASVPRSVEDPKTDLEVNVSGTLNVLLAAAQNRVKKVVFSSSAAVYGDVQIRPTSEDVVPYPLSPYAVGKLAAENYCRVIGQIHKLPTVCLRYFNVYGPRQDPTSQYSSAISKFITGALAGNRLVIFGDGEQTRDFVFVQDVVSANILAAENDARGTFNISSGVSVSVNELASLVTKLSGRNIAPVHQPARQGDILHSLADISLARSFGYAPKYDLEAGLADTLTWFQLKADGREPA